ncbi:MAG TPA: SpoIIE family protein phosphatase [Armatimonadota bacterium]
MTLRRKTLIAIFGTLLCLVALLYAVSAVVILRGAKIADERESAQTLARVNNAVNSSITTLNHITHTAAARDDVLDFMRYRNPVYILDAYSDSTFRNLNINYVVIADRNGRIIFFKGFDVLRNRSILVPEVLRDTARDAVFLRRPGSSRTHISGSVSAAGSPVLISAWPVAPGHSDSRRHGAILIGKRVDSSFLGELSKFTEMQLDQLNVSDWIGVQQLGRRLGNSLYYVAATDAHRMAGYVLFCDIEGKPVFVLKTIVPRSAHDQAVGSILYLLMSILVIGLVFAFLVMRLLERLVLGRLHRLGAAVKDVGSSGDFSGRVVVDADDELGTLAERINRTLEALDSAQRDLMKWNEELDNSVQERASELASTQKHLKRLVESSPAVMYTLQASGDYGCRYISDNVVSLTGFAPYHFLGGSNFWKGRIHPEDTPGAWGILPELFEKGYYEHSYRFLHRDGTYRWMEDVLTIIRDRDGKPSEILGHWIDITERKRAEDAIQESRRILEALMENVPEGIVVVDADLRIRAESAYAKALVHTTGQPLDARWVERSDSWYMLHEDGETPANIHELPLTRAVRDGETVTGEDWIVRFIGKGDLHILCNAGPIRDADGNVTGGVFAFRDWQALRAEREALKTAYDKEHRIVDLMQRALMPDLLAELPGYGIVGRYKPAWKDPEVGGDFYDVFSVADGKLALVIGDVSGKGLEAAVHTAMAKYLIRAYAHLDPNPASVLKRLNAAVHDYIHCEQFITIFYGILDPDEHTLVYANGGHNEPLFYSNDVLDPASLEVTGMAVGVMRNSLYETRSVSFDSGDYLVLYTDGITESGTNGEFLGLDGLARALATCRAGVPSEIADSVMDSAVQACGGNLRDDAAVLVVRADNY